MTTPVLFAGGSGVVGRTAIKWFRERHRDLPIRVGGRDLQRASQVAREVEGAEAIAIDLDKDRMGLDADTALAAVVMLAPDNGLKGLNYAQDLGVPYLNIGNGLIEVGPEIAHFAHRPGAAPIVFASHWSAGAPLFLALNSAKRFEHIQSIRIGVVLDEQEPVGPSSMEDMTRLHDSAPGALAFKDGRRVWLTGDSAKDVIEAVDGRSLVGDAFAPFDIISLHAATRAPDVRFDLVTDISSSRRAGHELAAEIIVEIEGESNGRTRHARSTLEFKQGQDSLTGLGVVLSISTALGLNGRPPVRPGLYLPELLLDTQWFLDELSEAGAIIHEELR